MVRSDRRSLRALALGVAAALTLAACGGASPSASESTGESAGPSEGLPAGGTIYMLTASEQIDQVDPQRAYTGEDLAFFSATIYRSLTAYTYSADNVEASQLVGDLATDTGTPSDGARTWSFTLRDGVSWQDGSELTCEDVKYGTSRTFATSVISGGPTYAIAYLDIPSVDGYRKKADGTIAPASVSAYGGPYSDTLAIFSDEAATVPIPNDTAAFDAAVVCDGKTITFHLNNPVADFNYTVTLGFSPVPEAADTGENYGSVDLPVSSGPYQVESYTTGNGGKMILVRNPNWDRASDPNRPALPDGYEIDFGIAGAVIDQRLIASAGNDQYAIPYGGTLQTENLAVVFVDKDTPQAQFAGRAVSQFDIYVRYYWINVNKVTNVKIRQAMAVALDREALRLNAGGDFYGDFADGLIKPNIGQDYAPTGFWDSFFGHEIPATGDVDLAIQLIEDSGEAAPSLTFDYADTPTNARTAAIVVSSLGRAGITVTPNPIEPGKYYSVVFDPAAGHEFGMGGWGADWPNASTVVAPLFTQKGGWDLSQVDDAAFNAKVDTALSTINRAEQASLWQALNQEAVENVYAIPTFFGLQQRLAGTKIGNVYFWGPYGSWPYGDMYVLP